MLPCWGLRLRHADLELNDLVDRASDLEHDGLFWQKFSQVSASHFLLYFTLYFTK